MRIIGGHFKGRKIFEPIDKSTRPLKDLVRESIFNILEHSKNHLINFEKTNVLDLFSGTGSLGLESLSRGAQKVTFIEKNFEHFDKLKGDVKKLDTVEDISIINRDVLAWLDEANDEFDLIFVDPPFYEQLAEKVLLKIKTKSLLAKSGNIYLEVEKDLDLSFLETDWEVMKETNSGRKQYLLLKEK